MKEENTIPPLKTFHSANVQQMVLDDEELSIY